MIKISFRLNTFTIYSLHKDTENTGYHKDRNNISDVLENDEYRALLSMQSKIADTSYKKKTGTADHSEVPVIMMPEKASKFIKIALLY